MKLNVGDKVIWTDHDDYVNHNNRNFQIKRSGKVVNIMINDTIVIHWDNGSITHYSKDQIRNMLEGNYSGTLSLDVQANRQNKLEKLGI